jgi:hypothetical protein
MSLRIPTLLTAGLLGALLAVGSFATVHAGDGCGKDKKKGDSTSTLWCPASVVSQTAVIADPRS